MATDNPPGSKYQHKPLSYRIQSKNVEFKPNDGKGERIMPEAYNRLVKGFHIPYIEGRNKSQHGCGDTQIVANIKGRNTEVSSISDTDHRVRNSSKSRSRSRSGKSTFNQKDVINSSMLGDTYEWPGPFKQKTQNKFDTNTKTTRDISKQRKTGDEVVYSNHKTQYNEQEIAGRSHIKNKLLGEEKFEKTKVSAVFIGSSQASALLKSEEIEKPQRSYSELLSPVSDIVGRMMPFRRSCSNQDTKITTAINDSSLFDGGLFVPEDSDLDGKLSSKQTQILIDSINNDKMKCHTLQNVLTNSQLSDHERSLGPNMPRVHNIADDPYFGVVRPCKDSSEGYFIPENENTGFEDSFLNTLKTTKVRDPVSSLKEPMTQCHMKHDTSKDTFLNRQKRQHSEAWVASSSRNSRNSFLSDDVDQGAVYSKTLDLNANSNQPPDISDLTGKHDQKQDLNVSLNEKPENDVDIVDEDSSQTDMYTPGEASMPVFNMLGLDILDGTVTNLTSPSPSACASELYIGTASPKPDIKIDYGTSTSKGNNHSYRATSSKLSHKNVRSQMNINSKNSPGNASSPQRDLSRRPKNQTDNADKNYSKSPSRTASQRNMLGNDTSRQKHRTLISPIRSTTSNESTIRKSNSSIKTNKPEKPSGDMPKQQKKGRRRSRSDSSQCSSIERRKRNVGETQKAAPKNKTKKKRRKKTSSKLYHPSLSHDQQKPHAELTRAQVSKEEKRIPSPSPSRKVDINDRKNYDKSKQHMSDASHDVLAVTNEKIKRDMLQKRRQYESGKSQDTTHFRMKEKGNRDPSYSIEKIPGPSFPRKIDMDYGKNYEISRSKVPNTPSGVLPVTNDIDSGTTDVYSDIKVPCVAKGENRNHGENYEKAQIQIPNASRGVLPNNHHTGPGNHDAGPGTAGVNTDRITSYIPNTEDTKHSRSKEMKIPGPSFPRKIDMNHDQNSQAANVPNDVLPVTNDNYEISEFQTLNTPNDVTKDAEDGTACVSPDRTPYVANDVLPVTDDAESVTTDVYNTLKAPYVVNAEGTTPYRKEEPKIPGPSFPRKIDMNHHDYFQISNLPPEELTHSHNVSIDSSDIVNYANKSQSEVSNGGKECVCSKSSEQPSVEPIVNETNKAQTELAQALDQNPYANFTDRKIMVKQQVNRDSSPPVHKQLQYTRDPCHPKNKQLPSIRNLSPRRYEQLPTRDSSPPVYEKLLSTRDPSPPTYEQSPTQDPSPPVYKQLQSTRDPSPPVYEQLQTRNPSPPVYENLQSTRDPSPPEYEQLQTRNPSPPEYEQLQSTGDPSPPEYEQLQTRNPSPPVYKQLQSTPDPSPPEYVQLHTRDPSPPSYGPCETCEQLQSTKTEQNTASERRQQKKSVQPCVTQMANKTISESQTLPALQENDKSDVEYQNKNLPNQRTECFEIKDLSTPPLSKTFDINTLQENPEQICSSSEPISDSGVPCFHSVEMFEVQNIISDSYGEIVLSQNLSQLVANDEGESSSKTERADGTAKTDETQMSTVEIDDKLSTGLKTVSSSVRSSVVGVAGDRTDPDNLPVTNVTSHEHPGEKVSMIRGYMSAASCVAGAQLSSVNKNTIQTRDVNMDGLVTAAISNKHKKNQMNNEVTGKTRNIIQKLSVEKANPLRDVASLTSGKTGKSAKPSILNSKVRGVVSSSSGKASLDAQQSIIDGRVRAFVSSSSKAGLDAQPSILNNKMVLDLVSSTSGKVGNGVQPSTLNKRTVQEKERNKDGLVVTSISNKHDINNQVTTRRGNSSQKPSITRHPRLPSVLKGGVSKEETSHLPNKTVVEIKNNERDTKSFKQSPTRAIKKSETVPISETEKSDGKIKRPFNVKPHKNDGKEKRVSDSFQSDDKCVRGPTPRQSVKTLEPEICLSSDRNIEFKETLCSPEIKSGDFTSVGIKSLNQSIGISHLCNGKSSSKPEIQIGNGNLTSKVSNCSQRSTSSKSARHNAQSQVKDISKGSSSFKESSETNGCKQKIPNGKEGIELFLNNISDETKMKSPAQKSMSYDIKYSTIHKDISSTPTILSGKSSAKVTNDSLGFGNTIETHMPVVLTKNDKLDKPQDFHETLSMPKEALFKDISKTKGVKQNIPKGKEGPPKSSSEDIKYFRRYQEIFSSPKIIAEKSSSKDSGTGDQGVNQSSYKKVLGEDGNSKIRQKSSKECQPKESKEKVREPDTEKQPAIIGNSVESTNYTKMTKQTSKKPDHELKPLTTCIVDLSPQKCESTQKTPKTEDKGSEFTTSTKRSTDLVKDVSTCLAIGSPYIKVNQRPPSVTSSSSDSSVDSVRLLKIIDTITQREKCEPAIKGIHLGEDAVEFSASSDSIVSSSDSASSQEEHSISSKRYSDIPSSIDYECRSSSPVSPYNNALFELLCPVSCNYDQSLKSQNDYTQDMHREKNERKEKETKNDNPHDFGFWRNSVGGVLSRPLDTPDNCRFNPPPNSQLLFSTDKREHDAHKTKLHEIHKVMGTGVMSIFSDPVPEVLSKPTVPSPEPKKDANKPVEAPVYEPRDSYTERHIDLPEVLSKPNISLKVTENDFNRPVEKHEDKHVDTHVDTHVDKHVDTFKDRPIDCSFIPPSNSQLFLNRQHTPYSHKREQIKRIPVDRKQKGSKADVLGVFGEPVSSALIEPTFPVESPKNHYAVGIDSDGVRHFSPMSTKHRTDIPEDTPWFSSLATGIKNLTPSFSSVASIISKGSKIQDSMKESDLDKEYVKHYSSVRGILRHDGAGRERSESSLPLSPDRVRSSNDSVKGFTDEDTICNKHFKKPHRKPNLKKDDFFSRAIASDRGEDPEELTEKNRHDSSTTNVFDTKENKTETVRKDHSEAPSDQKPNPSGKNVTFDTVVPDSDSLKSLTPIPSEVEDSQTGSDNNGDSSYIQTHLAEKNLQGSEGLGPNNVTGDLRDKNNDVMDYQADSIAPVKNSVSANQRDKQDTTAEAFEKNKTPSENKNIKDDTKLPTPEKTKLESKDDTFEKPTAILIKAPSGIVKLSPPNPIKAPSAKEKISTPVPTKAPSAKEKMSTPTPTKAPSAKEKTSTQTPTKAPSAKEKISTPTPTKAPSAKEKTSTPTPTKAPSAKEKTSTPTPTNAPSTKGKISTPTEQITTRPKKEKTEIDQLTPKSTRKCDSQKEIESSKAEDSHHHSTPFIPNELDQSKESKTDEAVKEVIPVETLKPVTSSGKTEMQADSKRKTSNQLSQSPKPLKKRRKKKKKVKSDEKGSTCVEYKTPIEILVRPGVRMSTAKDVSYEEKSSPPLYSSIRDAISGAITSNLKTLEKKFSRKLSEKEENNESVSKFSPEKAAHTSRSHRKNDIPTSLIERSEHSWSVAKEYSRSRSVTPEYECYSSGFKNTDDTKTKKASNGRCGREKLTTYETYEYGYKKPSKLIHYLDDATNYTTQNQKNDISSRNDSFEDFKMREKSEVEYQDYKIATSVYAKKNLNNERLYEIVVLNDNPTKPQLIKEDSVVKPYNASADNKNSFKRSTITMAGSKTISTSNVNNRTPIISQKTKSKQEEIFQPSTTLMHDKTSTMVAKKQGTLRTYENKEIISRRPAPSSFKITGSNRQPTSTISLKEGKKTQHPPPTRNVNRQEKRSRSPNSKPNRIQDKTGRVAKTQTNDSQVKYSEGISPKKCHSETETVTSTAQSPGESNVTTKRHKSAIDARANRGKERHTSPSRDSSASQDQAEGRWFWQRYGSWLGWKSESKDIQKILPPKEEVQSGQRSRSLTPHSSPLKLKSGTESNAQASMPQRSLYKTHSNPKTESNPNMHMTLSSRKSTPKANKNLKSITKLKEPKDSVCESKLYCDLNTTQKSPRLSHGPSETSSSMQSEKQNRKSRSQSPYKSPRSSGVQSQSNGSSEVIETLNSGEKGSWFPFVAWMSESRKKKKLADDLTAAASSISDSKTLVSTDESCEDKSETRTRSYHVSEASDIPNPVSPNQNFETDSENTLLSKSVTIPESTPKSYMVRKPRSVLKKNNLDATNQSVPRDDKPIPTENATYTEKTIFIFEDQTGEGEDDEKEDTTFEDKYNYEKSDAKTRDIGKEKETPKPQESVGGSSQLSPMLEKTSSEVSVSHTRRFFRRIKRKLKRIARYEKHEVASVESQGYSQPLEHLQTTSNSQPDDLRQNPAHNSQSSSENPVLIPRGSPPKPQVQNVNNYVTRDMPVLSTLRGKSLTQHLLSEQREPDAIRGKKPNLEDSIKKLMAEIDNLEIEMDVSFRDRKSGQQGFNVHDIIARSREEILKVKPEVMYDIDSDMEDEVVQSNSELSDSWYTGPTCISCVPDAYNLTRGTADSSSVSLYYGPNNYIRDICRKEDGLSNRSEQPVPVSFETDSSSSDESDNMYLRNSDILNPSEQPITFEVDSDESHDVDRKDGDISKRNLEPTFEVDSGESNDSDNEYEVHVDDHNIARDDDNILDSDEDSSDCTTESEEEGEVEEEKEHKFVFCGGNDEDYNTYNSLSSKNLDIGGTSTNFDFGNSLGIGMPMFPTPQNCSYSTIAKSDLSRNNTEHYQNVNGNRISYCHDLEQESRIPFVRKSRTDYILKSRACSGSREAYLSDILAREDQTLFKRAKYAQMHDSAPLRYASPEIQSSVETSSQTIQSSSYSARGLRGTRIIRDSDLQQPPSEVVQPLAYEGVTAVLDDNLHTAGMMNKESNRFHEFVLGGYISSRHVKAPNLAASFSATQEDDAAMISYPALMKMNYISHSKVKPNVVVTLNKEKSPLRAKADERNVKSEHNQHSQHSPPTPRKKPLIRKTKNINSVIPNLKKTPTSSVEESLVGKLDTERRYVDDAIERYTQARIHASFESFMQEKRPCYVENCGFKQQRCGLGSIPLFTSGDEHVLNDKGSGDTGSHNLTTAVRSGMGEVPYNIDHNIHTDYISGSEVADGDKVQHWNSVKAADACDELYDRENSECGSDDDDSSLCSSSSASSCTTGNTHYMANMGVNVNDSSSSSSVTSTCTDVNSAHTLDGDHTASRTPYSLNVEKSSSRMHSNLPVVDLGDNEILSSGSPNINDICLPEVVKDEEDEEDGEEESSEDEDDEEDDDEDDEDDESETEEEEEGCGSGNFQEC